MNNILTETITMREESLSIEHSMGKDTRKLDPAVSRPRLY